MPELTDKVAIVTGAAQGIGKGIAEVLAADGAKLFLADIQEEKLKNVADVLRRKGASVKHMYVDISDPKLAEAMSAAALNHFGQIDALVNNGAIDAPRGLPHEITEEEWRKIIEVDLNGAWWCAKAVLQHMMERRSGRIVSITSGSSRGGNPKVSPAYAAAKAGIIGLTAHLSVQVEKFGILVNCIMPGPTGTGVKISKQEQEEYLATHPLGFGGAEPIAHAVRHLLRPSGAWISGAVMNVSGGRHRGI